MSELNRLLYVLKFKAEWCAWQYRDDSTANASNWGSTLCCVSSMVFKKLVRRPTNRLNPWIGTR